MKQTTLKVISIDQGGGKSSCVILVDHMGGSEVLVICSIRKPSEHCVPQTINGCSKNK